MNALDCYLAERLFGIDTTAHPEHDWDDGYHDIGDHCGGPECRHCGERYCEHCHRGGYVMDPDEVCQKYVPRYSSNLTLAWRALERFKALGGDVYWLDDAVIDGWMPLNWTEEEFAGHLCDAMRDYLIEKELNK